MVINKRFDIFFIAIALLAIMQPAAAQGKLRGTVYDSSGVFPLPFVSVLSNSGRGTWTDVKGNYEIKVTENDSVWFSYLGKPTRKYAVQDINDLLHFNISILINIPVLKEIRVKPRNYREDSIQNRLDYAKGFNYRKPTFRSVVTSISITGFTVDIDELIRVFQYRKKHNAIIFRERLIREERNKFIDNRFSKGLVLRLTGLSGNERDSFMVRYRPGYEFTKISSDYEFSLYIKKCFQQFGQYQ